MTARGQIQALRWFLSGEHIQFPKEKPVGNAPEPDKEFEQLVLKMPWLEHLNTSDSFIQHAASAADRMHSFTATQADQMEVSEDDVFAGLEAVEKARIVEAAVVVERGPCDFYVKENYGESNLKKGKAFHDAVQGVCKTKDGDKWARNHGLQVTFKMTFSEHDEEPARIVARAWAHRMQYFFDYERTHGGDGFVFNAAIQGAYIEPDELGRLYTARTTKPSTQTRIDQIRRLPKR